MNPESIETYILYFPKAPDPKDHSTQGVATHRIAFRIRRSDGSAVCFIHYRHPRVQQWCTMPYTDITSIPNLPESLRDELKVSVIITDVPTARRWWEAFRKKSWVRGE